MFTQIFSAMSFVLLISAGPAGESFVIGPGAVQNQSIDLQSRPLTIDSVVRLSQPALFSGGHGVSVLNNPLAASPPAYRKENKKDAGYILQKVKEWRAATLLHKPGEPDRAASEIGGWHQEDLEIVLSFMTELASKPVKEIRRTVSRTPIRSRLQLTARESQQGDLNRVLKQGALLHTDIATLGLRTGRVDPSDQVWIFLDGRIPIAQPREIHWTYARRLIDSVSPSPSQDDMVRQWYVATIACMHSRGLLVYAKENIEMALDLFPSDDKILFYAGAQHETWALPALQNTIIPPGGSVSFGSRESELKKAEKLYRKALETNPDFAEAHLHLGRILLLLDNPHQAFVELRKAAAVIQDRQLSYYNALYTGRALEMLARPAEAEEQYELAATLYPTAQSPLLALSLLAQSDDDPEDAILDVQRVFELPHGNGTEDDPWWIYNLSHVRDADMLMEEMQTEFGRLPR